MVDPFAWQNPANAQQSDSNANPSQDAFGWAPSVFADMAATAFQPIDPETWKPVPHTPDTLDPFLRDTGSDTLDTSQETLSQEETEQLNDPFLDQSQQDDVNLHAASIDSEVSSSEEVQEQKEEKIPEDVVIKEPTEESVSQDSVVEPEISEEKEAPIESVVEEEKIIEEEETPKDVVIDEATEELISEESSVKDEQAPWDTKEDSAEEVSSPSPSTQEEIHVNDPFLASVQDTVEQSVSEEDDKEKEEDVAPVVDPFLDDNVADQSEEPVENVHHYDPFLDDSIADEPQDTSEQNDSVEVPEDIVDDSELVEEEKTPEDVEVDTLAEEPVSEQSVVEPEVSEEKEELIEEIVEKEKVPEEENIVDSPVEESVEDVEEASDSSWEEIVDPFLSMDMEPEVSTQDVVEEPWESQVESELPVQEDHSEKEEQPEDQIVIEEPNPEIDIEDMDSALENDMSEEPVLEDVVDQNDEEGSDTSVDVSEDEVVPEDVSLEGETSENIVQWMVDGMVDPFLSTQPVDSEEWEQEQIADNEEDSWDQELSPPVQKVDEDQSEETDISAMPSAELSDDEESSLEGVDEEDPSQSVEQTVQEVVEDTRAQQMSHLLAKFQELVQAVRLVHDRLDNNEDFVVVGADNDALYTTYAFHLDVSVEQSVCITKETTNRKDDDYMESHVMRFVASTESILHVYVDDVLLFTEEQLQDDVKSTMQVMDKLNKFIFLVTQFADDHSVVSWDTEKATQDFDGF